MIAKVSRCDKGRLDGEDGTLLSPLPFCAKFGFVVTMGCFCGTGTRKARLIAGKKRTTVDPL